MQTDAEPPNRRTRFGAWIAEIADSRGYGRRGGRAALAEAARMSPSSVGRMLAGEQIPEVHALIRLAHVLGVSVREILIESGTVNEGDLPGPADHPVDPRSIDLFDIAARAGIPPEKRALFASVAQAAISQLTESDARDGNRPTMDHGRGSAVEG